MCERHDVACSSDLEYGLAKIIYAEPLAANQTRFYLVVREDETSLCQRLTSMFFLVPQWHPDSGSLWLFPLLSRSSKCRKWNRWAIQHLSRTQRLCRSTGCVEWWPCSTVDQPKSRHRPWQLIHSIAKSSSIHLCRRVDRPMRRSLRIDRCCFVSFQTKSGENRLHRPKSLTRCKCEQFNSTTELCLRSALRAICQCELTISGPDQSSTFLVVDKPMYSFSSSLLVFHRTTSNEWSDSHSFGECLASIE